ncbi:hypothetical protein [Rhodopirellula sp. MGV]|uniref:hypothetical protein n=1 Tax=Rhodopirellula sp. MGV TaxID=2023130 RepID=UPI000B96AF4E|nr:hypothetical protein [Rhodopirellula sp. MGV]PNY33863.1 hypothetical protein C2E31_25895 [Rhodopirellula baltica]
MSEGEQNADASGRRLETLFFGVNFTLATMLFITSVIAIVVADNPYSMIGGLLLVLPVLGYAIAEWIRWYRQVSSLDRPMG